MAAGKQDKLSIFKDFIRRKLEKLGWMCIPSEFYCLIYHLNTNYLLKITRRVSKNLDLELFANGEFLTIECEGGFSWQKFIVFEIISV